MDVAVAFLEGEALAVLSGVVEGLAVENEFGAEGLHGGDFDRIGVFGESNHDAGAEMASGAGDRLAVVAGGGGDEAAAAFLVGEVG